MQLNRRHLFIAAALAIVTLLAVVVYTRMPAGEGERPEGFGDTSAFKPATEARPVPALAFTDAAGKSLTLADFRGKVVVLNLWATWCTPCVAEMPMLDRLQKELGDEGVVVLALSIDRGGSKAVQEFFERTGVRHLGVYVDPSMRSTTDLRAPGLPTTLLIDPEGTELGRVIGPMEWDSPEAKELVRTAMNTARTP
ncbi:MAG: TlpA family protein disulfide reductase [Alphaproteobacteria bacterium]|nr:TlpA family protein disulfide reductase [Alphaproteobacteria bacterium]